jgi:hypothetical protein
MQALHMILPSLAVSRLCAEKIRKDQLRAAIQKEKEKSAL